MLNSAAVQTLADLLKHLVLLQLAGENGSVADNAMLTNYLVRALLLCGAGADSQFIQMARNWYVREANRASEIDLFLLEGLAMLGEEDNRYARARFDELCDKRWKNGRFEVPTEYRFQGDLFSTMFVLRVFRYLKEPTTYLPSPKLDQTLDWVYEHRHEITPVKDRPLPAYLLAIHAADRHSDRIRKVLDEIWPTLEAVLQKLPSAVSEGAQWDFSTLEDALWLAYDLQPLAAEGRVAEYLRRFMAIANDRILPGLKPYAAVLDLSFEAVYLKTRIFSLVLAVCAGTCRLASTGPLFDTLLSRQATEEFQEWLDRRRDAQRPFVETIRRAIEIELKGAKPLPGGYSGSQIYRINADINLPLADAPIHLPGLIFKISDTDSFEREVRSFESVPPFINKYFAEVSRRLTYQGSDGDSRVVLVMEDLTSYETLQEIVASREVDSAVVKSLLEGICNVLQLIYRSHRTDVTSATLFEDLHLSDILKSLSVLARTPGDKSGSGPEGVSTLLAAVQTLLVSRELYVPIGSTLMHGDLNLRNVMILAKKKSISVKLIDLDQFSLTGDYVYDLGELLVDLAVNEVSGEVSEGLRQSFRSFAASLNDQSYGDRLMVSELRSFLRLAKIHTNRGRIRDADLCLQRAIGICAEIREKVPASV